jgi:hypothetical protein
MLARFCATDHQFAPKEFLIVQFLHRPFCFIDGLHLDKSESFGPLIVPIAYDFGVLDVTDAIKQLKQVALGRVEGKIPDVKSRGRNFDGFRFTRRTRRL